jgi:exodeoxyribonuclease VII small subunit
MAKEITLKELVDSEKKIDYSSLSFEKGIALLEELISNVEGGSLPLDKSIQAYQRGAELMTHLRGLLEGAEEKLKILQLPKK